ncbi:MAG: hypothetical protein E6K56_03800 [Ignavibacteria bacterium]|nr:MAG: hypothetical protein E6K56_03800 [Ignavibacteria bacterium]
MNDMNLPELPDDSMRKVLKKLPPVKAAPDFEARLKRRLLEPSQESGAGWRQFFAPRRVPAFAYSLVALIAVGYFSYYIFWRTPVAPPPVEEPAVRTTGHAAPPPVEEPRVPSMYRAVPPSPPVIKQGESQTAPRSGAAQGNEKSTQAVSKGSVEKRAAGERAKQAAPSASELEKEAQLNNERVRAGETTSGAASAPAREATQLKSDVKIQPREENKPAAESPLESKARRLATPSVSAPMYQMESRGMVSIPVIDSAAVRDSLRLDSLNRAEKARQELLKKPKVKKPGR